jgi:hypothetical protein
VSFGVAISRPAIDAMVDGFHQALGGRWVPVSVDAARLIDRAAIRVRAHVCDMVPAFRHFRTDVKEWELKVAPPAALVELTNYVYLVEREREVRRWSFVDL